jgi:hypothetical protein
MSRFAVEWLVPGEPDRFTRAMLLDMERPAPYVLAVGHGADKVHALLSLWRTHQGSDAAAEAIDYIAAEVRAQYAGTMSGMAGVEGAHHDGEKQKSTHHAE